jgi:hypothetical protein
MVAPMLDPARTLPSGRYRLCYHLMLGSVGGSEVTVCDWSV